MWEEKQRFCDHLHHVDFSWPWKIQSVLSPPKIEIVKPSDEYRINRFISSLHYKDLNYKDLKLLLILEKKNKIIAGICNLDNKKACQDSDIQVEMIKHNRSFIKLQKTGSSSDNEWQRVVQPVTTNGNEWYNEWQRMVQQMTTSDN